MNSCFLLEPDFGIFPAAENPFYCYPCMRKIGKVGQRMRNSFNTISCLVWTFYTKKQDMTRTLQKTSKAICRCGFKLRVWIWVRITSVRATHSDLCRDSQSSLGVPLLSSRCSWAPRMCQRLWGHQASSDLPRFYPENTVHFAEISAKLYLAVSGVWFLHPLVTWLQIVETLS